jgi:hypothetical protein
MVKVMMISTIKKEEKIVLMMCMLIAVMRVPYDDARLSPSRSSPDGAMCSVGKALSEATKRGEELVSTLRIELEAERAKALAEALAEAAKQHEAQQAAARWVWGR